MGYRVVAPLVYLKVPDVGGALVSYTYYAGAPVPDGVDPESLQHHLDSGLVLKEADPVADLLAVPAGTPIPDVEKPSAADPKADWVAYAVSQGMLLVDAEASTKAALQERFA